MPLRNEFVTECNFGAAGNQGYQEIRVGERGYVLVYTRRSLAFVFAAISLIPTYLSAAEFPFHRHRPGGQELWARTELYFGSEKPDGSVVSRAEFMHFVDKEITPRFPDGLTLLTAYGQFLDSGGVIEKERSMLLILFYPITTLDANKNIQEVRENYKSQFHQESVLRVDSVSNVSF